MKYFVINKDGKIEDDDIDGCPDFYYCENDIWKTKDKIGFMVYVPEENTVELKQIFIDPKYRRKKYGTKLLNKLIDFAKENKMNTIWLMCSATPEELFAIWLNTNGFVREGSSFKWIKTL